MYRREYQWICKYMLVQRHLRIILVGGGLVQLDYSSQNGREQDRDRKINVYMKCVEINSNWAKGAHITKDQQNRNKDLQGIEEPVEDHLMEDLQRHDSFLVEQLKD